MIHKPLIIVGGGIVGLWCAIKAVDRGIRPVLVDAANLGRGASGGHLGALMPHHPMGWTEKKEAQLQGLLVLETEIARIESMTGMSCGYRRTGRLVPLRNEEQRERILVWAEEARRRWPSISPSGQPIDWKVLDENPFPEWVNNNAGPAGFALDSLSARIAPKKMIAAMSACLHGKAEIRENRQVDAVMPDGVIRFEDGAEINGDRVILTAGWQSSYIGRYLDSMPLIRGVKGQSALLQPTEQLEPGLPVLFDTGIYAIVHDDGLVAVGSTSEREFSEPFETDEKLDAVVDAARKLSPALRDAKIVERWAGLRPKGPTAAPVVQGVGDSNLILATGGYKITFAMAHGMADKALALARSDKESP